MKTTATFKLSKPTKRFLATLSGEDRKIYKKLMIEAEHVYSTSSWVVQK